MRSRGRRSRREELAAPLDVVLDPAEDAVSLERRTELLAAVRALPDPMRLVVTCRYLLDLDEQETAVVLGWPRGTVKSRLHRALGRLRDSSTRQGGAAMNLDDELRVLGRSAVVPPVD